MRLARRIQAITLRVYFSRRAFSCGRISCQNAGAAQQFTLKVDAKSNIFAVGAGGPAANGGGIAPAFITFKASAGRVLTFSSVTGRVSCCGGGENFNDAAGGNFGGGGSDIQSSGGISGIVNPSRTFFLLGVFLDDQMPKAPGPARLNASDSRNISPQLYQTFEVGSGKGKQFEVPATATRLFLGFADGGYFHGAPCCYDDNVGELVATFTIQTRANVGTQTQSRLPDLNGVWIGEGYGCHGNIPQEEVRIEHNGSSVVATKNTGDNCVGAGEITWRGTFDKSPFPGKFQADSKTFADVTVEVKTADLIVISGKGYTLTFTRKPPLRITLQNSVLFENNSSDLRPEAETALEDMKSSIIDKHPNAKLRIEGYTDDTGSDSWDVTLSTRRAQSVAAWFRSHGIEASRIEEKGYGKANPEYPNTTEENRARNRRVEIVVVE